MAVVSFSVADVRTITTQEVRHTPKEWPNWPKQAGAHADVIGPKDVEVQVKLARFAAPEVERRTAD